MGASDGQGRPESVVPCTLAAGVVVAELDLQPSLLHGATFPPGKEKLLSDLIPVLSGLVEALTMSPCAVIFLPFFLLPFFFLSFLFLSFFLFYFFCLF